MRWWLKLVLGLVAIVLLMAIVWNLGGFMLRILNAGSEQSGERDPMFAEEPEIVTQAPQTEESGTFQDNSANWSIPYHTPIDQEGVESPVQVETP